MCVCVTTSPQFYRSVAAALAWAELAYFVVYPLCTQGVPAVALPVAAGGTPFRTTAVDLAAVVAFRALPTFLQACSVSATKLALVVQLAVLGFVGAKWHAVLSIGANDASSQPAGLVTFVVVASITSVLHCALSLNLVCDCATAAAAKRSRQASSSSSSSSSSAAAAAAASSSFASSSSASLNTGSSDLRTPLTTPNSMGSSQIANAQIANDSESKASTTTTATTAKATGPVAVKTHPGTMHWWPVLIMPIRVYMYVSTMALMLPLGLVATTFRALYQRCKKGKGSAILHGHHPVNTPSGGYALQMVFDHPFETIKLTEVVEKLSAECGIDASLVRLDFAAEEPYGDFPAEGQTRISGDHYVTPGANFLNNMDSLKIELGLDAAVWMRIWNGKPGKPTVIQMRLPGFVWDGTSCFNFTKEMCNRYAGGAPVDIFRDGQLTLSPNVKNNLDNFSFLRYLFVQQPFAITYNIHRLSWRWGAAIWPACGGPGRVQKASLLNFSEEETTQFARAVKARGIKPFAAMAHAAVAAHTKVEGFQVNRIIMQASMQTRGYVPLVKERNIIGDWLVGPVQRLGREEYTVEVAQREYNKLIAELTEFPPNGEVSKSFHAKAYGWYQHGASMFELHPYYPYDAGVWGPSVFFNNYGPRTINADIGLKSWNWAAPYYLCCNTICINGKNSIAVATQCLPQETLDAICDQLEVEMRAMMEWV